MPRSKTNCETLTIGQLARRWGISRDHARQLVDAGYLPGAFKIPSAGRYGATVKIPLASVIQAETEDWLLMPVGKTTAKPKPLRRGGDSGPALRHFPKLRAMPEHAAGSLEAAGD
jgi:hypothetical protein